MLARANTHTHTYTTMQDHAAKENEWVRERTGETEREIPSWKIARTGQGEIDRRGAKLNYTVVLSRVV